MHKLTPEPEYRAAVTVEYRGIEGPATGPEESPQTRLGGSAGSPLVENRAADAHAMSMSTRRALNRKRSLGDLLDAVAGDGEQSCGGYDDTGRCHSGDQVGNHYEGNAVVDQSASEAAAGAFQREGVSLPRSSLLLIAGRRVSRSRIYASGSWPWRMQEMMIE
jgi:hypothetical protein